MIKKIVFLFYIFFAFLLFYLPLSNAACSLGANPLGMEVRARPGEKVVGTWNLYNLYGDRTTHITIEKIKGEDWEISFDPALHEASYDVSGEIQRIRENIALEQSSVILEIPESVPEGVDYVKHPNQEGFIPVKPVRIYITLPENAEIGKDYKFVFEARGSCFSEQVGAAIPGVATQLEFNVKPTTEFYEKPIKESESEIAETEASGEKEEKEQEGITRITGAVIGTNLVTGFLAITTFILIIVIVFLLVRIKKSK